jgi:hypothetical protein
VINQPAAGAATTSPPRCPAAGAGIAPARLTHDVRVQSPRAGAGLRGFNGDIVDEWGQQSFPASDPPANW